MNACEFKVNLPLDEVISKLDDGIISTSITGVKIDNYIINLDSEKKVIVLVYEKHFYRAGNRLTLTITIDNTSGVTKIHSIGGGGGEGFFRFDWGASEKFTLCSKKILNDYIILE